MTRLPATRPRPAWYRPDRESAPVALSVALRHTERRIPITDPRRLLATAGPLRDAYELGRLAGQGARQLDCGHYWSGYLPLTAAGLEYGRGFWDGWEGSDVSP